MGLEANLMTLFQVQLSGTKLMCTTISSSCITTNNISPSRLTCPPTNITSQLQRLNQTNQLYTYNRYHHNEP